MKSRRGLIRVALILYLLLGLSVNSSLAEADTGLVVTVEVPAEVSADGKVVARVEITQVTGFDACQFDVAYAPDVLEVTDVTAGEIGGTSIPIDMWGEIAEGKIRIIGNAPGVPGVDGSGYLAEIHFRVIGADGDDSEIELSNGLLGDKDAEAMTPVSWQGASVRVVTSTSGSVSKTAAPTDTARESTNTPVPSPKPTATPSPMEPTATEGAPSLQPTETPSMSTSGDGDGSGDQGLPALTYGLIFLALIITAALAWIYSRRTSS